MEKIGGLLQSLSILEKSWVPIFIIFISRMPHGQNLVFMVIDLILESITFILTPELGVAQVAMEFFYRNVLKYF